MKFIRRTLLLLALSVAAFCTKAQIDYPVFKSIVPVIPADSQWLSFNLYNLNYVNDQEWFGNIPLSGTLFGYEIIPELQYQISPKLVLRAGLYLQKEFGRPNYTTDQPTFTLKYKAKHSSFLIGTLEGTDNHEFIEPIYDYKWLINERLENGFQFKVDTKPYWHDLFINWRVAIHPGDPFKEQFDIGYSGRFNVFSNGRWSFKIPLQLLYSHAGGQYDSVTSPLVSITNSTIGASLTYTLNHKLLKRIVFENNYVNYKDISFTKVQPFGEGNGYLSHLLFDFKNVGIDLRYWNSEGYIAPRGMALFEAVSQKYPGLVEKHRELLIASFIFDKEIFPNVYFDFRILPYKDFIEKITSGTGLEYSYEMYIKYDLNVKIKKLKNNFGN
jgi:hypothetical protein